LNRDGTFNVVRHGVHRSLFHDFYHTLLTVSWPRFWVAVVLTYVSMNLLFGSFYFMCGPQGLAGLERLDAGSRFLDCYFFSVQTLATIGYGRISPVGLVPNLLVTLEALVGVVTLAVTTGLVFTRFSKPTARVMFSQKAVLSTVDGVPSLIFRVANTRLNQIVEAQMTVTLTVTETTQEGTTYRNIYDLKLERAVSSLFSMSWTVIHPIDSKSPLYGKSKDELLERDAEIMVVLTGTDEVLSQTVHARWSYVPEEIVWNAQFADILSSRDDGKIDVNMARFDETSPG
jgi:inward rectifier potassium channel